MFLLIIIFLASFCWSEIVQVDNGHLVVRTEVGTGKFAIGTVDGKSLVDGFSNFSFNTHFNLNLDGVIYSNSSELDSGGLIIYDSARVIENFVVMQWRAGNTRIWQKISLYPAGEFDNWAYIEFGLYNEGSDTHWVGWLSYIDIMADENDNPAIWTPENAFLQTERAFYLELSFPSYWLAISDTSVDNPFIVKGAFEGTDTTYPSFIAFSDAIYLEPVRWMFMTMGRTVYDWAILCKWNPVIILPYQFRVVGFKYGIPPTNFISERSPSLFVGQPHPNPTNGAVSIPVQVGQSVNVRAEIFNLAGQRVNVLHNGIIDSGTEIVWKLEDLSGEQVSSGVYFLSLLVGSDKYVRTIVVVR